MFFFFSVCSKCEKLQIGVCSIHCNLKWVKEPSVVPVTGGLTKARATIPENMDLKASSIPGNVSFTFISLAFFGSRKHPFPTIKHVLYIYDSH